MEFCPPIVTNGRKTIFLPQKDGLFPGKLFFYFLFLIFESSYFVKYLVCCFSMKEEPRIKLEFGIREDLGLN